MKYGIRKLMEVTAEDFIQERVINIEKAINTQNFNTILDAIHDYLKLEESMSNSGYSRQTKSARKKVFEKYVYQDFKNMRFDN